MKTAIKNTYGLRNNVDILSTKESAFRYASNCIKLHVVILGENCKYWVVCFSDAQKLVKAGFELAN